MRRQSLYCFDQRYDLNGPSRQVRLMWKVQTAIDNPEVLDELVRSLLDRFSVKWIACEALPLRLERLLRWNVAQDHKSGIRLWCDGEVEFIPDREDMPDAIVEIDAGDDEETDLEWAGCVSADRGWNAGSTRLARR
jgi:hypothetical protein